MTTLFSCRCLALELPVFAWLFFALPAFAQIDQPSRFETEHKFSDQNYTVISLQKEGIILIRDNDKHEDGKKIWEIVQLDTALQKQWEGKITVEPRFLLVGHEYQKGKLFLLYRIGDNNSHELRLVTYELDTHQWATDNLKLQVDFKLNYFSVCHSSVILGGYIVREPAIFLFDIREKQMKVVPGFFLKNNELLDVRVNHNNTFNVLVIDRNAGGDEKKLTLRTYDPDGTALLEEVVSIKKGMNILSAFTSSLLHDDMIIVGTYGLGNTARQATGFFSTIVDPFSEQPVFFTELANLNHYTDYLGKKRSEKIKAKTKRLNEIGRPASFKNETSLVRIEETGKGFLLITEGYQANNNLSNSQYWNNFPYNYGYGYGMYPYRYFPYGSRYYNMPYSYGNTTTNNDVKMEECALVFFDKTGKVDWDESFKLDNIKLPSLEQASDIVTHNSRFVIGYKKKSDILTKEVTLYDATVRYDTTKIKTGGERDVIRNESEADGGIRFWYDGYFYVWGYQTIRHHSEKGDDLVRSVFYVNKVLIQ